MKQARLFLLASFTASYAAIQKQQSVQLFLDRGVWQITSAGDHTRSRFEDPRGHVIYLQRLNCSPQVMSE